MVRTAKATIRARKSQVLLLALAVATSPLASAQVKDDLFSSTGKFAQGASAVTEINLDPKSMGMLGKDSDKAKLQAQQMKLVVVHSYAYDKPGMYRMEDFDAYRKKLEDGTWSCSVRVRKIDSSTDICSRTASDHETNELVILTAKPQKITFIHLLGKLSLDELNQMQSSATALGH